MQQLEQLAAALKLPAADMSTLRKGLSFLAALAWLQLPQGLDLVAAAAATDAPGSSKKAAKKKQKASKGTGEGAVPVLVQPDVQQGLQLAASIQPQPGSHIQHTAAARLVGLLHALHSRAGALAGAAAHQKQPKQQHKGAQAGAGQDAAGAATAARAAAAQTAETLTVELLQVFTAGQQLPGVAVKPDEDIADMVEQLGQLAAVVEQHVPAAPATAAAAADHNNNSTSSQQHQQAVAAGRKRVVLHLVHQLQLQLLCGGLSAEAAGSVVDDLEVSALKGLGLNGQLLEQLRAADAQAKLKLAGGAAGSDDGDDDDDAAGSGSGNDDDFGDDDEDGAAWQDVLLDLLLSLLSNSSSEGGGGSRGGVFVPSVPLREACEAVFKAFAEEMTSQGEFGGCVARRTILLQCDTHDNVGISESSHAWILQKDRAPEKRCRVGLRWQLLFVCKHTHTHTCTALHSLRTCWATALPLCPLPSPPCLQAYLTCCVC